MDSGHTIKLIIESSMIFDKEKFWDWFLHRESIDSRHVVTYETKKEKRLEINILYRVEGGRNANN